MENTPEFLNSNEKEEQHVPQRRNNNYWKKNPRLQNENHYHSANHGMTNNQYKYFHGNRNTYKKFQNFNDTGYYRSYYNNEHTVNYVNHGIQSHNQQNRNFKKFQKKDFVFDDNYNQKREHRFSNKKQFNNVGGTKGLFKRNEEIENVKLNQRDSLTWQLTHNKYECMICVLNIKSEALIWSCENCYHIFHISCIKKWANTCDSDVSNNPDKMSWRCPACQKQYEQSCDSITKEIPLYLCFCGKTENPGFKRGNVPHTCNEVCSKPIKMTNGEKCPHLCTLPCHPGPCPPCEAIVTRNCHCNATRISVKCTADASTLVCGSICNRNLNCGIHQCEEQCHMNQCCTCEVDIEQICPCDKRVVRTVKCGSLESQSQFNCDSVCGRLLQCGNHRCESFCHFGECNPCKLNPDLVIHCWCGKNIIEQILEGKSRKSCLDPIPSCKEICDKLITSCQHVCSRTCHEGSCEPCPLSKDIACRCGKTIQTDVLCSSKVTTTSADGSYTMLCSKVCNKKLNCGRHRCLERCCDFQIHFCSQACGRTLSCKSHFCERGCGHVGSCPTCQNVSFEEQNCECGASVALPPIACGQLPPACKRICSRQHDCDHPVRHNCHSELMCPPCTELISKSCPGNHKILDNIPCFRSVATCGLVCGRPLLDCEHHCIRLCHQGDCKIDGGKCSQPCKRPRADCKHPCSEPCHDNDCQDIISKCMFEVVLHCTCKVRSMSILCHKLKSAISFIKFNNGTDTKRENLEIILSDNDETVILVCDVECKKVARDIRLADAFDVSITSSNLNTYYSDSLKSYAKKNIDFLLHVENVLLNLTKNVKNATNLIYTQTIKNLTEDKADFFVRYSSCFKINCKCNFDSANKFCVVMEINRTTCCVPKPLLSHLLRIEFPLLFPVKNNAEQKSGTVTSGSMSFAERIRLSKRE